jgi:hypothetical protein
MGGGLMQLVAYGAQDIYLTGNPQITFFKVVYRRHTNFSMEAIRQTFSGSTGFGNDVTATISRNGDLVYRMYLEHTCTFDSTGTTQTGLCEHYGHSLIKECEIEIGGQKIDRHTSMWNRVWSDLTQYTPSGHFGGIGADEGNDLFNPDPGAPFVGTGGNSGTLYQLMTGNGYGLLTDDNGGTNPFGVTDAHTINGFTYNNESTLSVGRIFLPLNFWFCRNPGLALPLIALQYHEVKVKMTFEELNNLARSYGANDRTATVYSNDGGGMVDPTFDLWCDYIYLDTDERRRFAQVSHEYLIEQLQHSSSTISNGNPTIDLNFNHPVKELIWTSRNEGADGRCAGTFSAATGVDPTAGPVSLSGMSGEWQLQLNGHDRFKERDTKYFTRTQVHQHHTGYGAVKTWGHDTAEAAIDGTPVRHGADSIAVYSFALKPEEHQPSGTCNFSRIDNAQLVGAGILLEEEGGQAASFAFDGDTSLILNIFAVNYNVLRIMSGMGGLAYSN